MSQASTFTLSRLSADLTYALSKAPEVPKEISVQCALSRGKLMVLLEGLDLHTVPVTYIFSQVETLLRDWLAENGLPVEADFLSNAGDVIPVKVYLKKQDLPKPIAVHRFNWLRQGDSVPISLQEDSISNELSELSYSQLSEANSDSLSGDEVDFSEEDFFPEKLSIKHPKQRVYVAAKLSLRSAYRGLRIVRRWNTIISPSLRSTLFVAFVVWLFISPIGLVRRQPDITRDQLYLAIISQELSESANNNKLLQNCGSAISASIKKIYPVYVSLKAISPEELLPIVRESICADAFITPDTDDAIQVATFSDLAEAKSFSEDLSEELRRISNRALLASIFLLGSDEARFSSGLESLKDLNLSDLEELSSPYWNENKEVLSSFLISTKTYNRPISIDLDDKQITLGDSIRVD